MQSVLVIRRDNIGDLVCTTPLFRTLREHFPDARLCALVNPYNRAVLDNNPIIDKIYAFPNERHWPSEHSWREVYGQQASLLLELRREKFDCIVQASRSTRRQDKIFGRLIGGKRYLRRDHDPDTGHETTRTVSVLKPLNIGTSAIPEPRVYPDIPTTRRMHSILQNSVSGACPSAIHLSARNKENQWPLERYREFLRRAVKEGGRFVVLWSPGDKRSAGHPGDDEKAASLKHELAGLPITFLPTHTVTELISVLAVCANLIGCDGGHCHLASGLGTPVLGLYCDSKVFEWRPWGPEHRIVSAPLVPDVRVDDVLTAYRDLPTTLSSPWVR